MRRSAAIVLGPCAVGLVAAAIFVGAAAPVAAQVVPCRGLTPASGYKVLLDVLVFVSPEVGTDREMQALLDRLQNALHFKLEELRYLKGPVALEVLQCVGRKPKSDGDFDAGMVDALNTRGVVLEIWGSLDGRKEGARVRDRSAAMRYVVVPLRHYERGSPQLPGGYRARYVAASSGVDYLQLIEQAKDLDAYVAMGIGIKLLKSTEYDRAREYLCKADHLMRETWGEQPPAPEQQALVAYVTAAAREALKGSLGVNSAGNVRVVGDRPCPKASARP